MVRGVALALLAVYLPLLGCARFKPVPEDHYVFVTSKQAYLRDRVAAVSNRTGQVANGDRLKVLDHARHWVKVQTAQGAIGWIEEKAVATDDQAEDFQKLEADHKGDVPVASGVVRDQVYMHIRPGRDSEHFYLLNEGDKLQLLRRATLEKATPGVAVRAQRAIPQAAGTNAARKDGPSASPSASVAAAIAKGKGDAAPAPPAMEDWWLARDAAGHTGWLYARMVDVDAPDALTRYAEGQKFVGAYVLTTVHDEEAPGDVKDVPIYLAVMAPYKAGLPYDFDQVRVFTWSLQHHRYETAFREKNIEGFLPVQLAKMKDPGEKAAIGQEMLPAFTYHVLAADAPPPMPDPETGLIVPGKTIAKTYRLEGNITKRISSGPGALTSEVEAHPAPEPKKEKKGKKK
jgi:SH3-like domain-containing protein